MLYIPEYIQCIDFCKNGISCINGHLTAVTAIGFIAIVFCRVMACCYHNAGTAMQGTNSKGQHWGWFQFCIDVYFDTICSEDFSSRFCKVCGLNPAVIGDCNTWFWESFFYIISQSLCCSANCVNIHTVGTGTDYTTQTTGSKCKITVEAILNPFHVMFNCF